MANCQKCDAETREEDLVYRGVLNGQLKLWCENCVAEVEAIKPAGPEYARCNICKQPSQILTSDGVCHPCAEKEYLRPSWPLAGE